MCLLMEKHTITYEVFLLKKKKFNSDLIKSWPNYQLIYENTEGRRACRIPHREAVQSRPQESLCENNLISQHVNHKGERRGFKMKTDLRDTVFSHSNCILYGSWFKEIIRKIYETIRSVITGWQPDHTKKSLLTFSLY